MEFVEKYSIEKLTPWENNPRDNEIAAERLVPLIEKYGFINPIIIDQSGIIRAGHTRLKAAKKMGLKEVPVIIIKFERMQDAIGYAIADNKSHELSEWDIPGLAELLKNLQENAFDLSRTGFSEVELSGLLEEINLDNFLSDEPREKKKENFNSVICPFCGKEFNV